MKHSSIPMFMTLTTPSTAIAQAQELPGKGPSRQDTPKNFRMTFPFGPTDRVNTIALRYPYLAD